MQICEVFPRLAAMADKFAVVRSLIGNQVDHDAIQVFNGFDPKKPKPAGGWPQFGSAVARLEGARRSGDARVHEPLLYHHARALQRAGTRLPRHGRRTVSADRADP